MQDALLNCPASRWWYDAIVADRQPDLRSLRRTAARRSALSAHVVPCVGAATGASSERTWLRPCTTTRRRFQRRYVPQDRILACIGGHEIAWLRNLAVMTAADQSVLGIDEPGNLCCHEAHFVCVGGRLAGKD